MEQNIQTEVMIIYDQQNHIEVNYLSAFWKWLGIMVTERTFQSLSFLEGKLPQEQKLFDCTFVIGNPPTEFTNYFTHFPIIHAEKIYSLQDAPVQIDKWIKKYSKMILSCNQTDDLVDLYRKYECYKTDLIIELNYNQETLINTNEETKNEIKQIIDKLNKLITEVQKLPNQSDESNSFLYYKKYVEASNMHKVNLLLNNLHYNHYYTIETPTEILIDITHSIPKFSSAYIKIAEIMKNSNYRTSIYPYYKKALNSKDNAPFLSDTCLAIKKLEENKMNIQAYIASEDVNKLIYYIQKAIELDPINYKAYFQYAALNLKLKKYKTTIDNYRIIIDIINSLSSLEQLSPFELNYVLKSYILIGSIHGQYWADDIIQNHNTNKALKLRDNYLKNNLISKYYFSDNPSYFKKKLLTKTDYLD